LPIQLKRAIIKLASGAIRKDSATERGDATVPRVENPLDARNIKFRNKISTRQQVALMWRLFLLPLMQNSIKGVCINESENILETLWIVATKIQA